MWSLLGQKPLSRLGKLSRAKTHETILELADAYSLEKNEIYFDRDPHLFPSILNFYREIYKQYKLTLIFNISRTHAGH